MREFSVRETNLIISDEHWRALQHLQQSGNEAGWKWPLYINTFFVSE